jgi:hypothetical protein
MPLFTAARIALNPIQWSATSDGWLDPSLAPETVELLRAVHDWGFPSIMCAPPPGWGPSQYQEAVRRAELTLAPGYAVYRGTGTRPVAADEVDAFRALARVHAELGLDRIGIRMGMAKDGLARRQSGTRIRSRCGSARPAHRGSIADRAGNGRGGCSPEPAPTRRNVGRDGGRDQGDSRLPARNADGLPPGHRALDLGRGRPGSTAGRLRRARGVHPHQGHSTGRRRARPR